MAIKPKEPKEKASVKTTDGLDLTIKTNVRIIQRDLAAQWPSSDANAENINVFQDYLSMLLGEGWVIEESKFFERRGVGPAAQDEYVYPIALLLTRADPS